MREFELYLEGYQDRIDSVLDILSWLQANLINIHIPRGKPRVTAEKIRPRNRRKRREQSDEQIDAEIENLSRMFSSGPESQKDEARAARERARNRVLRKQEEEDSKRFWGSNQGNRIKKLLEVDEDE